MRLKAEFVPRDNHLGFQVLREIRNTCSEGFTHNQQVITPADQERYRCSYSENVRHYLYYDLNSPSPIVPVGFSRLEWKPDGLVYPTYGVASWARGKGYAWDIVMHAMLAAGGPLRGDLLVTNEAIKKVDYALGWRPVGDPVDGVQVVESQWPPKFVGMPPDSRR